MNPFEMVIGIVLITGIVSVLRAKYGADRPRGDSDYPAADANARIENIALKDEMRGLKERIAVLERLATEDSEAKRIDREIEKLRDRT